MGGSCLLNGMHITRVTAELLRLPLPKLRSLPSADDQDAGLPPTDSVTVLFAQLETDIGLCGLGFGYAPFGGRAVVTLIQDELSQILVGGNPTNHERLHAALRNRADHFSGVGLAVVDIAIWDLKAKAANLPLWRLLGGARESAPARSMETAGAWMSAEQVLATYEPLQAKGVQGLTVGIGGRSPEADAKKLEHIRNIVGLDDWLGVVAHGAYDFGTALAMGRFLEEEMDADWFADPLLADDRAGLRRLADRLEIPIAAGARFSSLGDFTQWMTDCPSGVVCPDILRLGGITPFLRTAHMADALKRPVVPVGLPEVNVHLACGLPNVRAVDCVGWLDPLWLSPPELANGKLAPPPGPGLGLEPNPESLNKFRVDR